MILLSMNMVSANVSNFTNNSWVNVGLGNSWESSAGLLGGEGMQQVWDIDWNQNSSRLYLVTDTMKVWRSDDSGTNWKYMGAGNFYTMGGSSVVSDYNNLNVVFATASPMSSGTDPLNAAGIYRSIDGGVTWNQSYNMNFSRVKHGKTILIDNQSSNGSQSQKVYVGGLGSIVYSINGGYTWYLLYNLTNSTNRGEVYDMEFLNSNVTNNTFILFSTNNSQLIIINLSNNATVAQGTGLPGIVYDFTIKGSNNSIVFAGTTNGVYRSNDSGANFANISVGLTTTYTYNRLTMSILNNSIMYASPNSQTGGSFPYVSSNGGGSWSLMTNVNSGQFLQTGYFYAEVMMPSTSSQQTAITQRDSTIAKTYNMGVDLNFSGSGFSGINVQDIKFINSSSYIVCGLDYGAFMTRDSGSSFTALTLPSGRQGDNCQSIDCQSNGTCYASFGSWTSQDIYKTNDWGTTWTNNWSDYRQIKYIRFVPGTNNLVSSWSYYNGTNNSFNNYTKKYEVRTIDPRNSSWLWAYYDTGSVVDVSKSSDYLLTLTNVGTNISTGSGAKSIAVNPNSAVDVVAFGNAYRVRMSTNNASWVDATNGGLPVGNSSNYQNLLWIPSLSGTLLTANTGFSGVKGNGIYVSYNNGTNWSNANNNIGNFTDAQYLGFDNNTNTTYMSIYGLYAYGGIQVNITGNTTNSSYITNININTLTVLSGYNLIIKM